MDGKQACRGMRTIYSQKVTLVPIKEMTDVLSVEKKSVEIDQDTWVRVKTGIYKGDLAKVKWQLCEVVCSVNWLNIPFGSFVC